MIVKDIEQNNAVTYKVLLLTKNVAIMKKTLFVLFTLLTMTSIHNRAVAQYFGIGINVPVLATGTINASFEAAVASHWSLDIPFY